MAIHSRLSFTLFVSLVSVVACGSDKGLDLEAPLPENNAADCNPLGTVNCLMPWPSAAYLDEDPSTATGYRVSIPEGAMPMNIDGIRVDPNMLSRFDGFAPSGFLVAGFEKGVSVEGLPPADDLQSSLATDAPIVLINMKTGERVPYFAEIDMTTQYETERSLIIRPMARMQPGTRHAVGITKRVRAADGSELAVPPGFQALVDGTKFNHPIWDKIAPRYEQIFPALADHGYGKEDLLLAWDFVTASDEFLTSDLLTMRDAAVDWIADSANQLTFDIADVDNNEKIRNFYVGTHTAPNFLTAGEDEDSVMLRDERGLPYISGTYTANWAAIIPRCVEEVALPVPVMVFGHGLYGTGEGYLDDDLLQDIAQENCMIVVAGDFIGLTERQIALTALTANEFSRGPRIVEKLGQGIINFITLEHLVNRVLWNSPEFKIGDQQLIDPDEIYYFGASLGGILGNVFMAYDPNIRRGALGVPGGAWSLLFERSVAWSPIQGAAFGAYENQYVYQTLVAMWGILFEPYDSITTAGRVLNDPMPNTPAKQLFLYEALEDSLVTNIATEFVAREMGIEVSGPSVRVPWNMTANDAPLANALAIYDEKVAPVPTTNAGPMRDNGTHSDVHKRKAVQRQIEGFLLGGQVVNECKIDGIAAICDCTTGACE